MESSRVLCRTLEGLADQLPTVALQTSPCVSRAFQSSPELSITLHVVWGLMFKAYRHDFLVASSSVWGCAGAGAYGARVGLHMELTRGTYY